VYGALGRVALVGGDCVVFRGWRVGSFGLCWGFEEKGGRGEENDGRCDDSAIVVVVAEAAHEKALNLCTGSWGVRRDS
jgi:hypothetical protein